MFPLTRHSQSLYSHSPSYSSSVSVFRLNSVSSSRLHVPPTGTLERGKGGENEIRQLTKFELTDYLIKARKSLGLIGGITKCEVYEMLELMEKLSHVMPGKRPQRNEFLAYGHFVDGMIESACGVGVNKVCWPWEMEVLAVVNSPKMNRESIDTMLGFIGEMCQDNACLPSFESLKLYESLKLPLLKLEEESARRGKHLLTSTEDSSEDPSDSDTWPSPYSHLYEQVNKAFTMSLSSTADVCLDRFWFAVEVSHNQHPDIKTPVFLRQMLTENDEVEILFKRPQVGAGRYCGTAGGFIVLKDGPTAVQVCPKANSDFFESVSKELSARLKHPQLDVGNVLRN